MRRQGFLGSRVRPDAGGFARLVARDKRRLQQFARRSQFGPSVSALSSTAWQTCAATQNLLFQKIGQPQGFTCDRALAYPEFLFCVRPRSVSVTPSQHRNTVSRICFRRIFNSSLGLCWLCGRIKVAVSVRVRIIRNDVKPFEDTRYPQGLTLG